MFQAAHTKLGLKGDVALARTQWLEVQANKWKPIWLWPSMALFVVLAFFALAFRDKPEAGASPSNLNKLTLPAKSPSFRQEVVIERSRTLPTERQKNPL